jgi:hypothetical protein
MESSGGRFAIKRRGQNGKRLHNRHIKPFLITYRCCMVYCHCARDELGLNFSM